MIDLSWYSFLWIGLFYFGVGMITASTGGTSLFTVPLLIAFGVSPRVAVATNMFGLVFHSVGGAWGFKEIRRKISVWSVTAMLLVTGVGSSLGALIVIDIADNLLEKIIAGFAGLIVITLFWSEDLGVEERVKNRGWPWLAAGLLMVFILGIYGGFFSGGYVTLLSYVFILILGYNFVQAAYLSKVLNICSSSIATLIFLYSGLVNLKLGAVVALTFLTGSYLGAKYAVLKGSRWIRRLFILMTLILLLRLLLF